MTNRVSSGAKRVVQRALRQRGYVLRQIDRAGRLSGIDLFVDVGILMGETPTPTFFDVGANEGQTVARLADLNQRATIYAFEPCPRSFERLSAVYGRTAHVHLEHVAVGEHDGSANFYITSEHSVNDSLLEARWDFARDVPLAANTVALAAPTCIPVPVRTLDGYCSERGLRFIDFLKIDTQGYDLRVLRGARGMLEQRRIKAVAVELTFVPMYAGQGNYLEMLTFLDALGYRTIGFYEQTYRRNRLIYCNALFAT